MDEDDLEPPKPPLSSVKCPRCFEPVPLGATRCPKCREATGELPRSLPLILAMAGILAVIFLALLIYRTNANAQVEAPQAEQAAPGGFAPAPETSSGHETPPPVPDASEKPVERTEPEKKAPLDR
jgi:hypothetical protein